MKKERKRYSILAVAILVVGIVVTVLIKSESIANLFADQNSSAQESVVLIHGLGRNKSAMWRLAGRLEKAGYDVHRIGYSSINTTSEEVIADITRQIDTCCANDSSRLHFVGHSLGGLLIRAYLQDKRLPQLGNTVLVGTPNNGSGIADLFSDNCLLELLSPLAIELGTDEASLPNRLADPYYPVGIIAGVSDSGINDRYLDGHGDGMVPVESTKLEGMSDFIELETGHSMMRYDKDVAIQIIHFLQTGRFLHAGEVEAGRAG